MLIALTHIIRSLFFTCRRRIARHACFALVAVIPSLTAAQFRYERSVDDAFNRAIETYRKGDYALAADLFDSLARAPVVHQRTTASYIMEAKSLFHQSAFDRSITVIDSLRERVPGTTYTDDIDYTLGTDYLMLQKHRQAAEYFLRVLDQSADTSLQRKTNDLLNLLLQERLTADDLPHLYASARSEDSRDRIAARMITLNAEKGDYAQAQDLLAKRLAVTPHSRYRDEVVRAGDLLRASSRIRIGVLFPLVNGAGDNSVGAIARELLDGISAALKEYTRSLPSSTSITLDVRDIGHDSSEALRAVAELVGKQDLVCIIGPLFSDLVAAVAPLANRNHVPLLTPTATTTGLAAAGPYIFQTSPDYAVRGKAIAQYAIEQLGLKSFAVLRTNEPMGASGIAFAQEAVKSGATVAAQDTFSANVSTLHDQCIRIRRAVLGNDKDAEKLDIPVTLDGIYCAIDDADEISSFIPQLKFFNIHGTLLGNNEWYDPVELGRQKRDADGLVIASDSYLAPDAPGMAAFRALFPGVAAPTKYHATGYDIMKFLLAQTDRGVTSRDQLQDKLSRAKSFHGIHAVIDMGTGRVNRAVQILRVSGGTIENRGVHIAH